ncbi:MAG: hypothetical protein ACKOPS_18920, partial [Cyanobium sp.]
MQPGSNQRWRKPEPSASGAGHGLQRRSPHTCAAATGSPPPVGSAQFAELCRLADLFLDTGHDGAGASGAVALQAGLPLLTCPGQAFVSRMGASPCAGVGMEDM